MPLVFCQPIDYNYFALFAQSAPRRSVSMPYTVKSTEKLRQSASDEETKALLYLMNFRDDSEEIHYFVVDFFNDLTGMDRYSAKLWDIQSKAAKNNSPRAIGQALVTLFKNYLSEFDFFYYILFVGGVSASVRIDDSLAEFGISNINPTVIPKIVEGLKEEAIKKEYIENGSITDEKIEDFLSKVLFVVDTRPKVEYIKAIIKDHPRIIPEDRILEAIFNEIRNEQSNRKNTIVEGIVIETSDEALNYCRHLTNSEIRLLALSRIISRNPVQASVPLSFIPIYNAWPPERQKEALDECRQAFCRALFNKNAANSFWALFEAIYVLIVDNPLLDVQTIYQMIDPTIRIATPDFDVLSLKFFISVIKDGIQNEN